MLQDYSKLYRSGEFELIDRFFDVAPERVDQDVKLGIGDDGAVVNVRSHQQLVCSVDTLVEGVHFPKDSSPQSIAARSLACNLSDIAAMGSEPKWCLLSLSLPKLKPEASRMRAIDEQWLEAFAKEFHAILNEHSVSLIGGDTTQANDIVISITMLGVVPRGASVTRGGARPGDDLYVSGFLGEAAAGLADFILHRNEEKRIQQRFLYPHARVGLGADLCDVASSCIDVSDGLLADLGHIAVASNCVIQLELDKLLMSEPLKAIGKELGKDKQELLSMMLSGGDDYELCFTAPSFQEKKIQRLANKHAVPIQKVGTVLKDSNEQNGKVICVDAHGKECHFDKKGYQHFSNGADH